MRDAAHAGSATGVHGRSAVCTVRRESAIAAIASTTTTVKAMTAPAVAVSPARPWPHAKEDSVIEVAWSVEAHGGTGVWRVIIIAIGTDRLNPDADNHLCLSCRHQR